MVQKEKTQPSSTVSSLFSQGGWEGWRPALDGEG